MVQRAVSCFFIISLIICSGCSGFGGPKRSVSATFSPEKYSTLAVLVEQTDFGRTIEDAFVMGLMNKGYSVVSRNDVQQLVGEIQFQGSGLTQSDRVKLGQMLNVRGIVMVHLTKAYSETRDSSYTDRKGQYHSGSYTVHNAGIDARLIDVENGSIQWVSSYASGGLSDLDFFGSGDLHGTVQGVAERVIESLPDRFKKSSTP